jgi:hypothetical protein
MASASHSGDLHATANFPAICAKTSAMITNLAPTRVTSATPSIQDQQNGNPKNTKPEALTWIIFVLLSAGSSTSTSTLLITSPLTGVDNRIQQTQ